MLSRGAVADDPVTEVVHATWGDSLHLPRRDHHSICHSADSLLRHWFVTTAPQAVVVVAPRAVSCLACLARLSTIDRRVRVVEVPEW